MAGLFAFKGQHTMDLYERDARSRGFNIIAGVDEAGRGPLAGPVVAAAVIMPFPPPVDLGIRDSKTLSAKARERLAITVFGRAVSVGVGIVWPVEIDELNIHRASLRAMERAVGRLSMPPDILLVDGSFPMDSPIEQRPVISGDALSVSIAAASIVAKTARDSIMLAYHNLFPAYNFESNKGYPTKEHLDAIGVHGPTGIHRRSFRGVVRDLFADLEGS